MSATEINELRSSSSTAAHNRELILSLARPLSSLEKLELANAIIGESLKEGLEYPLDVEEGFVRNAKSNLTTAISNFKEVTRSKLKV